MGAGSARSGLDEAALRDAVAAACRQASAAASIDRDPAGALRVVGAAAVAAEEAQRLLREGVVSARRAGNSWEAVGRVLGVSRQAAQQRFGSLFDEPSPAADRKVVTRVTVRNEMDVLRAEQRDHWHLVGFGWATLVLQASDHPWEHLRLTFAGRATLRGLESDGWQLVGTWFPFAYLKRPTVG